MRSAPRHIGIVGASGYVGQALVASLSATAGVDLALFGRRPDTVCGLRVRSLNDDPDGFRGLNCIVHLAAITSLRHPEDSILAVNTGLAIAVAERAIADGVRRLVFVSSIGVHGRSRLDPITPDTPHDPVDAYGRSKALAETALIALADRAGLDLVILRPPMIYGPQCRGNFSRLARLVATGLPLPFGAAETGRSFCSIANAVSAIRFAIEAPSPPRLLLPADPEDVTTRDLVATLAAAQGHRPALFALPRLVMKGLLAATGRAALIDSLFGPLTIDRTHWQEAGWAPAETAAEGIRLALKPPNAGRTLLYLTTSTPYFLSHRLGLAMEAKRRGFDIAVAASDTGPHRTRLKDEAILPVQVAHVRRGMNPLADLAAALGIGRVIRRIGPEVVHCSGLKTIFLCALAGWSVKLPRVICLVTGLGALYANDRPTTRLARFGVESVLRSLLRRSQTVTVFQNRDDLAYFVERRMVRAEDARLILGSGVDVDEFAHSPEPSHDPPLVMFPARLLRSKGVMEFVQAARILHGKGEAARFALVGDLDAGNPDSLTRREIEAIRADGQVEVWGFRPDMQAVYAQSHLVCLPSAYREGVPRALIEAASVGRAIVTTDTPGCREIVVDGLNGRLVPARDAIALADALGDLLSNPGTRKRMGLASRQRAVTQFSSLIVNRATADLYEAGGLGQGEAQAEEQAPEGAE